MASGPYDTAFNNWRYFYPHGTLFRSRSTLILLIDGIHVVLFNVHKQLQHCSSNDQRIQEI